MQYFPVFIDTDHTYALVVGGGEVAARKLELLLKTHANITLVSPWCCRTVEELCAKHGVTVHLRKFEDDDINNKNLVFIATDDPQVNQHVHDLGHSKQILVNVVDNTPLCKFITPSIVDRSPILIAMSSGGVAPVLLRYLRQKLESVIPQSVSRLGEFSERFRDKVKNALSNVTERRYFWEEVLDGDIAEDVVQGRDDHAVIKLDALLANYQQEQRVAGQVYLVGAGPGDPDLLTFRALRLMQKADVVIYDRLVSPAILEMVRRDAEKIYVGKAKSKHTLPQDEINHLLVSEAQKGNRVVRLKGGDPFIFGRGGEEIQTLLKYNIGFEVVPGITAATGAATYAGIPLTHRDHAQSVVFATGHLKDESIDLNWKALAQPQQTLVFYMGLTGLAIISRELVAHGLAPSTPIALVESATLPNQRVVAGTLETIEKCAEQVDIKPPTLIIVGGVVALHEQLNWYQPCKETQSD